MSLGNVTPQTNFDTGIFAFKIGNTNSHIIFKNVNKIECKYKK